MASRSRHWVGQLYYYLAALIGLGFILAGAVGMLNGLIDAAIPRASPEFRWMSEPTVPHLPGEDAPVATPTAADIEREEQRAEDTIRRQGLVGILRGAVLGVVGAPVFLWHIRRARETEAADDDPEPAD